VDRVIQLLDGARADVRHLGPSAEFHGVPTISAGSPALSGTAAASCWRLAEQRPPLVLAQERQVIRKMS